MAQKKNVDIEIAANDTEVVAKCDHHVPKTKKEEMIITLRGVQVVVFLHLNNKQVDDSQQLMIQNFLMHKTISESWGSKSFTEFH